MKYEGTDMLDSKSVTEAEAKACPHSLSLWIFLNTFLMDCVRQKTSTD